MHIKRRGARALLYRSSWVAKGAAGNTHGYSTQTFVASLSLDAANLPDGLENKFSSDELKYLESKLFGPARIEIEQQKRDAEHRQIDPLWRLIKQHLFCKFRFWFWGYCAITSGQGFMFR